MDDTVKQIGERLKGLRDVLDVRAEDVAGLCGVSLDTYYNMEEGSGELSISNLQKISKRYGISLDVLLFGEEPRMSSYFLTRKGQGMSVERRAEYRYQSLAGGFIGRKAEPFIVLVEPHDEEKCLKKNVHEGQEFNVVIEGSMELTLGKKVLVLNEGDSIYFDATQPHCVKALNGRQVKLLAIII